MTRRYRSRTHSYTALALSILWLAGFEVLPWLHVATHGHVGNHHHDEFGAIIRDDEATNELRGHGHHHHNLDAEVDEHAAHGEDDDGDHADVHHPHHGHDDASHDDVDHAHHGHDDVSHDDASHESRSQRLRAALNHGKHSLAHHDVATTRPSPVLTRPLPIDRRFIFVFEDTSIEPYSFSPSRAVARGPPPTTFES